MPSPSRGSGRGSTNAGAARSSRAFLRVSRARERVGVVEDVGRVVDCRPAANAGTKNLNFGGKSADVVNTRARLERSARARDEGRMGRAR